MGRPKGSKNKPNDAALNGGEETRETIGGNGEPWIGLTDDEYQAMLFQHGGHLQKYKEALASKKAADAHIKNVCKIIKAELGANAIADIKLAIEAETPEGEAAIKARMESQARLLRWLGLPIGQQGALFSDIDRTPAVDKARAEGKRAGLKGERRSPPHDPSVPQHQAWIQGWQDGQAVLLQTKLRQIPPPDESARQRRAEYAADEQLGTEDQTYSE